MIVMQGAILTAGTFAALAATHSAGLDARQSVTVTFLTLAFAQLWNVFNMRSVRAGLLINEVTRNRWLWGALALCTALLAAPPYLPAVAQLLQLAPPTATMWAIVLASSLAPLVVTQTIMVATGRRHAGLP
jgi:Ca2+-transporting ATPase